MAKGEWNSKQAIADFIDQCKKKGLYPKKNINWREEQRWIIESALHQLEKAVVREGEHIKASHADLATWYEAAYPDERPLGRQRLDRVYSVKKVGILGYDFIYCLMLFINRLVVSDGTLAKEIGKGDVIDAIKLLDFNIEMIMSKREPFAIQDLAMDTLIYAEVIAEIYDEGKGHPDVEIRKALRLLVECITKLRLAMDEGESRLAQSSPERNFADVILNSVENILNDCQTMKMETGNPERDIHFLSSSFQCFIENQADAKYQTDFRYNLFTKVSTLQSVIEIFENTGKLEEELGRAMDWFKTDEQRQRVKDLLNHETLLRSFVNAFKEDDDLKSEAIQLLMEDPDIREEAIERLEDEERERREAESGDWDDYL